MSPRASSIGIVGLGSMGLPMAQNLARSEMAVFYGNRSRTDVPELEQMGCQRVLLEDLGRHTGVVVLSMPDGKAVADVLFGTQGVTRTLASGSLVIDTTTGAPSDSKETAERLRERGIDYVDAPVSGGPSGAAGATLSIMVGGAEDVVERSRPYLELLGKSIVRLGGIGAGQVAKACNQLIVGVTIEAVAEALTFASRSGLDPWAVREALRAGFAGSPILELHGERMLKEKFSPAAFTNKLQLKDLGIVCTEAQRLGIDLPAAQVARSVFAELAADPQTRDLDHSAPIVRFRRR